MNHVDNKPSLEYTIAAEPFGERLTRHVVFCIPARFALFACTMLLSLLSVAFITIGWIVANRMNAHITEHQRLVIYLHVLMYIIVLLFSIFGVYAVVSKNAKHPLLFCAMILGQILFGIGIGAICLFILFNTPKSGAPQQLEGCLASIASNPNNPFIKGLCLRSSLAKGVCLSLFMFMWLLEIFTFYAGNQYARQLYEKTLQDELFGLKTGGGESVC